MSRMDSVDYFWDVGEQDRATLQAERAALLMGEARLDEAEVSLARDWKLTATQGALAIMYGAMAVAYPGLTLAVFISLFGTFGLLFGAVSVYHGVAVTRLVNRQWWMEVFEGIVSMTTAIVAMAVPRVTALFIMYLLAAWAMINGLNQIVYGCYCEGDMYWLMTLNGASLLTLAFFLYSQTPAGGILALVWCLAAQAIISGFFLILVALRLRRIAALRPGFGGSYV